MRFGLLLSAAGLSAASIAFASERDPIGIDAAAAFGARPEVANMHLSPDGKTIVYLAPLAGQGNAAKTLVIAKDSEPKIAAYASGKPERLTACNWVANDRLVCGVYQLGPPPDLFPFARLISVNADGGNLRLLNKAHRFERAESGGGDIIDWLPDQNGVVLMSRRTGAMDYTKTREVAGLGVDKLDTRTLEAAAVQGALPRATAYFSDQRGNVRVVAMNTTLSNGYNTTVLDYLFHLPGSEKWQELCKYDFSDQSGFRVLALDHDLNVAYGLKKQNGRRAVYTLALDGSGREELVYARDDVDVDGLVQIGRRQRVVGVTYATDYRRIQYTDADIETVTTALRKVVPPRAAVRIVDSSLDETRLLILTSSDVDPGTYYLFDRTTHQFGTLLEVRPRLAEASLARVQPVSFSARDGVSVPGYLTLPPGKTSIAGLGAIVMPHGGPSARDEWGFNWLAQFFANQGYAVLQPNYRGSAGYGDDWFEKNGFRSWEVAIGDVLDAGRWLLSQGADAGRVAIIGWSYGGYAALQSVATDPTVFKAAIAIAPITDLTALVPNSAAWSNYFLMRDMVGTGPHVREGSPVANAAKIKAPVLLFHGTNDINVRVAQSQVMDQALAAAGVRHELVTYEGLDHHLDDSAVRTDMLRRSDAFLRAAFAH